MLFSQISEKSAAYISQEINLDKDREEILAYAIETMLLSFVGFILIILLGFLFNAALPAAIAAISGGLLRKLSGGAHFNTPYKCLVFGAIVYGLLGLVDSYDAITTNRTYKSAMSKKQALEELKKFAGTHYDPWLLKEFIGMME